MKGKVTTGEIQHQHMSFKKVNDYFQWKPQHTIDDGISKSIMWYKSFFNI
jgi:CDP-glucose 4,6-dehydratase